MTSIATKGGAVIIKDGGAAEDCKCCGGGGTTSECASCVSGAYPDTINATITMTVNDGTTTFPVALKKYYSTTDPSLGANIGLCAEYLYSVGAGANPGSVGYVPGAAPTISFTFKDIGPAVWAKFDINFNLSIQFGGNSYRPGGVAVAVPLAVRCYAHDNGTFSGGLKWSAYNVGPAYSSATTPKCYADYTGVSGLAIQAGNEFKKYPGTFSMAIVSVA